MRSTDPGPSISPSTRRAALVSQRRCRRCWVPDRRALRALVRDDDHWADCKAACHRLRILLGQATFGAMNTSRHQPIVLARYSVLKTGVLIVGALGVSANILRDAWLNGWRAPPGASRPVLYLMGYAAAPFVVFIALALLVRLLLSAGVAISSDQSTLVLNYPLRRKRIPIDSSVTVSARSKAISAPQRAGSLDIPPVVANEITFCRVGLPNLAFRTGLLTEPADIIVRRIQDNLR